MTTTYSRQNFVAFDSETGVISPLNLSFDGMVTAIEASEDETALFISGAFSQVNGITRHGIAKYDLINDRIDPTFAPTGMRTVSDIALAPNGAVIAAGNFSKKLMGLDPTTGEDNGSINVSVAGVVDSTEETRVREIAVSPDGTRLVATGNFATVNPVPETGLHAEPRLGPQRDRDSQHLARPPLRRKLRCEQQAGQCARRGLFSRRQLFRDRRHRRADRYQRDM
jgi:hypothetical protein